MPEVAFTLQQQDVLYSGLLCRPCPLYSGWCQIKCNVVEYPHLPQTPAYMPLQFLLPLILNHARFSGQGLGPS